MTVYSATSLGVGPLRIVTTPSLRVVSGPSDSRHAAFVVSTSHGSEAVYRRVIDAGGNCEESSRADLLEEMAARGARRAWGPVVLVVGVLSTLFALAASSVLALSLLIATVVGSVVIFRGDAARRRLFVLYVMDAVCESAYGGLLNGLGWIERSSKKWSARGVVVFAKPLAPLTTNIDLREVKLGITLRLQFAPDGVYVFSGAQMSFVPYGQLTVSAARHRQVQSIPASDSPRIGQQHKYTNKHGSPDRRHKFNPILPVVETGSVNFTSTGTLTETILLSNPVAAEHFGNAIGAMALQPAPTPPRLAAKPEPARTVTMMAPKSVAVPRRDEPAPAVIRGSANSVGIKREEPRPLSPQAPDGNALWISPSRAMLVHGLDIGGFVYVGQHLRGLDLTFEEPALIDPTLAIDRSNQGATIDHSVGYSLSYSKLPPHGRAAFLQWLSTGRRDPALPIGLVFLFLYGLERRAYEDLGGKGSDQADSIAIARELERLLAIYTNASFVGYGGRLLDLL